MVEWTEDSLPGVGEWEARREERDRRVTAAGLHLHT